MIHPLDRYLQLTNERRGQIGEYSAYSDRRDQGDEEGAGSLAIFQNFPLAEIVVVIVPEIFLHVHDQIDKFLFVYHYHAYLHCYHHHAQSIGHNVENILQCNNILNRLNEIIYPPFLSSLTNSYSLRYKTT